MSVSINTKKLQEMLSRASKGVGNNKLIPITSLVCVEVKDNILTLITTDATNYLYIKDIVDTDDFYAVIDADKFTKLVSKMTCENVTLSMSDMGYVKVKGNGNYKIELPVDEDGKAIRYPNPIESFENADDAGQFKKSHIQVILDSIQPSLAVTLEDPCYTGYYMHDKIVATDTYKIASMSTEMFHTPKLVSREFVNLLAVMTAENITWEISGDVIVASTDDCVIYGRFMEGIEDFSIGPITGLIDSDFESSCEVPKDALLQLLSRLALFVDKYDKNSIYLTFTNVGLQISSKSATGVEIIPYIESDNFKDYTCTIDIQMFMDEVKAIQSDTIELYYGDESDSAIKLKDGNITIIVALMEDE